MPPSSLVSSLPLSSVDSLLRIQPLTSPHLAAELPKIERDDEIDNQ